MELMIFGSFLVLTLAFSILTASGDDDDDTPVI